MRRWRRALPCLGPQLPHWSEIGDLEVQDCQRQTVLIGSLGAADLRLGLLGLGQVHLGEAEVERRFELGVEQGSDLIGHGLAIRPVLPSAHTELRRPTIPFVAVRFRTLLFVSGHSTAQREVHNFI